MAYDGFQDPELVIVAPPIERSKDVELATSAASAPSSGRDVERQLHLLSQKRPLMSCGLIPRVML